MNSSSPLTPSMSTIGAFVLLGFAGTSTGLTSASLFVGVSRKAPLLLLPWVIATTILLILLIITIFAVFFIGGHSYTAISAIAMAEAMFITCLGCLGVVIDFKSQLDCHQCHRHGRSNVHHLPRVSWCRNRLQVTA